MKFREQLGDYDSLALAKMSKTLESLGYEGVEVRSASLDINPITGMTKEIVDVKQAGEYFRIALLRLEGSVFRPETYKIIDIKAGNYLTSRT